MTKRQANPDLIAKLALIAYALNQDERGPFGITKQEAAKRIREVSAELARIAKGPQA
jgi:hypothetical protein